MEVFVILIGLAFVAIFIAARPDQPMGSGRYLLLLDIEPTGSGRYLLLLDQVESTESRP